MQEFHHKYPKAPVELTQEHQVKHSLNRAQRRTVAGKLLIAEAKIKDLIAENKRLKGELNE